MSKKKNVITEVINGKEYTTDGSWLLAHGNGKALMRLYAELVFFVIDDKTKKITPVTKEQAGQFFLNLPHRHDKKLLAQL